MSENGRNAAIDAFKGMAIIGVVVGHTLFSVKESPGGTEATFMSVVTDILFSGLMMFLVFSGYFYKSERKYSQNVLKRIIQFGAVLIALQIILPLIVAAVGYVSGNPNVNFDLLGDCIVGMLIGPFFADYAGIAQMDYFFELYNCVRSFYFLQMMLVGFLVFYAIADRCYKNPKLACAAIAICVAVECALTYLSIEYGTRLPFHAEMAPLAIAFMLVGLMLKRLDFFGYMSREYKTAKYWVLGFVFILAAAIVFCVSPLNLVIITFQFGYKFGALAFVPFFAGTFLAGIGLIMLSSVFNFVPKIRNIFSFVGRYTLWIFLTNIFFVRIVLVTYGKPLDSIQRASPIETMPEAVFYFFFSLAASLLLAIAVEKIKEKIIQRKNAEKER